ncbi:probable G-protein coupled receptor 139 [Pyxicephalus adspersus]|uniref:probable G-protein coupled receptor 139 n=1 Tax=Pyxicephalus adspersus TaxID=30357 RepID=UPI003B5A194C
MRNEHWMVTLQKTFYPLLAVIGIPSNVLTLLIFWKRDCGLSPSCRCYMVAMSIADTMVLIHIVILELILQNFTPEPFWSRAPWCMIRDVLSYGAYNSSVWLVVCFTFERFIAARTLWRKSKLNTKKCTLYVIGSVFTLSHLFSVPYFWANESKLVNETGRYICIYNTKRPKLYVESLVWFQNILVYILPYIIIFTLNAFVLRKICHRSKVHCEDGSNFRKQRMKSVVLLLTVSLSFVHLCTTRFVTQIIIKTMHYTIERKDYNQSINIAADIGTMLDLTNTAVNMYLYACTQSRFRKELLQMVKMVVKPCKTDILHTNLPAIFHISSRKRCCNPQNMIS